MNLIKQINIGLLSIVAALFLAGCDDSLAPEIKTFSIPESMERYESKTLSISATPQLGSISTYSWSASDGYFDSDSAASVVYTADTPNDSVEISVEICDSEGECTTDGATITITDRDTPVIQGINVPSYVTANSSTQFSVLMEDDEERDYTYFWTATAGSFENNMIQTPTYEAGTYTGSASIQVQVCDQFNICVTSDVKYLIIQASSSISMGTTSSSSTNSNNSTVLPGG